MDSGPLSVIKKSGCKNAIRILLRNKATACRLCAAYRAEGMIRMKALKKIALVTCGSNFERHGNTIRAMRRKLTEMGGYALYVITSYGVYEDGMDFYAGRTGDLPPSGSH